MYIYNKKRINEMADDNDDNGQLISVRKKHKHERKESGRCRGDPGQRKLLRKGNQWQAKAVAGIGSIIIEID